MARIQYEDVTCPERAQVLPLNDGIHWLRMPLPFALDHINLWLLRDDAGWVIVDTGVHSKTSRQVWEDAFAGPMRNEPATHVIATHLHPDHTGCAAWLVQRFDVDLWMTREEYRVCRLLVADTGRPAPDGAVRFYESAGFSASQLRHYREHFGMFGRMVEQLPDDYRRMRDGETLEFAGYHWQVTTGGGHSPEHACLYDVERNILISGDMLLPAISPNISVWPTNADGNPLSDWFAALRKLGEQVEEDVLVLPAHGKPFRGAHARIDQLLRNHERRLSMLLDACATPHRIVDLFSAIYSVPITDDNRVMATGEALAHVHYLQGTGELDVDRDDAGVNWYRRR